MKKLSVILMCSLLVLAAMVSCSSEPEVKVQSTTIADNAVFNALGLEAGTYKCETVNFKDGMTFTNEAGTAAFKLSGFTYNNGNFKTTMTKAAVSKAATEEKKELTFVPDKEEAVTVTEKECTFKDVKLTCKEIPELAIEVGADTTVTVPVKVTAKVHFTLSADWSEGGTVVLKSGTYYSNNTSFDSETTFYSDVECKTEAFKLGPSVYHKGTKLLVTKIKVGATEKELTFADPTFNNINNGASGLVWFKETGSIKDASTVSGVSFTLSFEQTDTSYFFTGSNYLGIVKLSNDFAVCAADGPSTTHNNGGFLYIKDSIDNDKFLLETVDYKNGIRVGAGVNYKNYSVCIPLYTSKLCDGNFSLYLILKKETDSTFIVRIANGVYGWCSAQTNQGTGYDIVTGNEAYLDIAKGTEIEGLQYSGFGVGSCDIEFFRDVKIKFAVETDE